MGQTGTKTTVNEDGVDKDAYTVTFTNGALAELEELQKSIKAEDLDSVLRVAIGVLKRLEELNKNGKSESK
jgi:hypothetical protein